MSGRSEYFLRSERAGFRLWSDADLPLAMMLWGDPEVTRLFHAGGPWSQAQVRARLEREIGMHAEFGVQYWPAFHLEDGAFIGCCGLRPRKPEERIFEFGVHLCRAYWGMGFATELGRAVIGHAFGPLGMAALFAGHNPANAASRSMLLKLGFLQTHDELYEPTGVMHTSYLLTRER